MTEISKIKFFSELVCHKILKKQFAYDDNAKNGYQIILANKFD